MPNIIKPKRKYTTGAPIASQLEQGELAINLFDKKIYSKDLSNNIVLIGSLNGSSIEKFKVANAVANDEAVNKGQVIELFSAYQPFPIGHTMMADIIYNFTLVEFGGLFNRLDYPKLWAFIESHPALLKTEAQWQTENTANGMCGFFSSGNGTTTFRVRNMEGAFQRSSNRGINTYEADIIKSHTHSTKIGMGGVPHFFQTYSGAGQFGPIYSDIFITGETGGVETRPKNIAKLPLIVYK